MNSRNWLRKEARYDSQSDSTATYELRVAARPQKKSSKRITKRHREEEELLIVA
jgi:hypothetical protein